MDPFDARKLIWAVWEWEWGEKVNLLLGLLIVLGASALNAFGLNLTKLDHVRTPDPGFLLLLNQSLFVGCSARELL